MKVKHTDGPWEWVKDGDPNWPSYDLTPGVMTKDNRDGTPWGDEIDQANARLIAAAPDLLDALIAADGLLLSLGHSLPQVKVAIAKAGVE